MSTTVNDFKAKNADTQNLSKKKPRDTSEFHTSHVTFHWNRIKDKNHDLFSHSKDKPESSFKFGLQSSRLVAKKLLDSGP